MPFECLLYKFTKYHMQLSSQRKFDKTFTSTYPRTSMNFKWTKAIMEASASGCLGRRGVCRLHGWHCASTVCCCLPAPRTVAQSKYLSSTWYMGGRKDGREGRREGLEKNTHQWWLGGEERKEGSHMTLRGWLYPSCTAHSNYRVNARHWDC